MKFCYFNGEYLPPEKVFIPVTDLVIQRGVGVFDTINTHTRRPVMMRPHLERLMISASSSGIELPVSLETISEWILKGISRFDPKDTEIMIRPYITGGDDYDENSGRFLLPRIFVLFQETVKPDIRIYTKGVKLRTVNVSRPIPDTKTINYMLSYRENFRFPDAFEILYCPDGQITESGHSSFFLVRKGKLFTAPIEKVLKGTTREIILTIAAENGIEVCHESPLLSDIDKADEAFITGSVKQVIPVTRINDTVIGNGLPGDMTRKLHDLYLKNIHRWLE